MWLARWQAATWNDSLRQLYTPQVVGMSSSHQNRAFTEVMEGKLRCCERGRAPSISEGCNAEKIHHKILVAKYVRNDSYGFDCQHAPSNCVEESSISRLEDSERPRIRRRHLDVGQETRVLLAEEDVGCSCIHNA